MLWMNEPPLWRESVDELHVTTGAKTDFWNRTFYGFIRSNGHFRHRSVAGDFSASVQVAADYQALYDQAGLMLWVGTDNWLKTGIEYTDATVHLSTVVTRTGYSDWSQQPIDSDARHGIELRLTRHGETLRVQFRLPGRTWQMIRLTTLPMFETVDVGMMCCTPERAGLEVTFRNFHVGSPIAPTLHDD
jgi:uncharacterized protein